MISSDKTFHDAVRALDKLLTEEGLSQVNHAYREATSESIELQYSSKLSEDSGQKVKPREDHVCIHRLVGEDCPDSPDSPCFIRFPGQDHLSEWHANRKTLSVVSQPYRLSFETIKEMTQFCENWGLTVEISAQDSWHFPGRTLFIEFKRAEAKSI